MDVADLPHRRRAGFQTQSALQRGCPPRVLGLRFFRVCPAGPTLWAAIIGEAMRRLVLFLLALALLAIVRTPASAQMSNMPEDLRARLAEINPALATHLDDANTVVIDKLLVQAWGRKPS